MRRHATTHALLVAVILAVALLASVLLPGSASAEPTPPGGPTPAVHSTDGGARALMGHLLGKRSDYDPAQATILVRVAHRICDMPGSRVTRADWVATFTLPQPSPTTGWTVAEANQFIDAAIATFCPWRVVR